MLFKKDDDDGVDEPAAAEPACTGLLALLSAATFLAIGVDIAYVEGLPCRWMDGYRSCRRKGHRHLKVE
jgi:hypothetical protein